MKKLDSPGLRADSPNLELDALLHPARAFAHPRDVVADPDLTLNEKRAILASWASDACAVEDAPALRRPADVPPVTFDDVMEALKRLDGGEVQKPSYGKLMTRAHRLKAIFDRRTSGAPIVLGRRRRRSSGGQGNNHSPTA